MIPVIQGSSTSKIIKKIIDLYGAEGCCAYDETIKYEKRPAIFLDRDGVINEEVEYLGDPNDFRLIPNVGEGLKKLQDLGFRIIVVTNQAGIALGYYTKEDFIELQKECLKRFHLTELSLVKYNFHHTLKRMILLGENQTQGCFYKLKKI